MRMKKWLAAFTALLIPAFSAAAAEGGVTLRTVSCFAGTDSAAEAYVEILNRYESESGNTVTDSSSTSDEAWKTAILKDFELVERVEVTLHKPEAPIKGLFKDAAVTIERARA